MALSKIALYELAQDRQGGFVRFKLRTQAGTVSDWIGGGWIPVPFAQLPSLVGILTTGNAHYEDTKGMFLTGSSEGMNLVAGPAFNPESLDLSDQPFSTSRALHKTVFGIASDEGKKPSSSPTRTKKTKIT